MSTGIAIYDPRRLSKEDFLVGFSAREDLAAFLIQQLRLAVSDGDARHRLILGPRGMGKTSLLRRIEIGVTDDPELTQKLLPLTFREEQYNVRALDFFWRNCGDALADWLEKTGDAEGAAKLDRALKEPAWREADSAYEAFRAKVAETGRRPLLLVDNVDLILEALPEDQHWALRRALQANDGPILYGAATVAPRQAGDREAAFYEFFRLTFLEPLSHPELMRCLSRLAEARGEAGAPVREILIRDPARIEVLHSLTGGNPRILTLLYQLLERAESDSVYGDLEALLDQMTPLYKARVEELKTELQRGILDAIALHWDPVTTHALAQLTRIETTSLPAQLNKLKSVGLIEEVPTSTARAGFQLVERFFNVWYLMRHGTRGTRQKMRWLTEFLRIFYKQDELEAMWARLTQSAAKDEKWGLLYGGALEAALSASGNSKLDYAIKHENFTENKMTVQEINLLNGFVRIRGQDYRELYFSLGEYGVFLEWVKEYIQKNPHAMDFRILLILILYVKMEKINEAAFEIEKSIQMNPNLARFWTLLGDIVSDHLGDQDKAKSAYEKSLSIEAENPISLTNYTWFLLKRGELVKAKSLRKRLIELPPVGRTLIDSGLEITQGNFGVATECLTVALSQELEFVDISFSDDLLRLLRLYHQHGFGERLIERLETTDWGERHAPVRAGFIAYVRGEKTLLDVNPEMRPAATRIFRWLDSHRRVQKESGGSSDQKRAKPKKRGRSSSSKARGS